MGFRLLPNGALDFDTLEEALAAQEAKQKRLSTMPPETVMIAKAPQAGKTTLITSVPVKLRPRPRTIPAETVPAPVRHISVDWQALGIEPPDHEKEILASVAAHDELSTRDLAALHPSAGRDIGKVMKSLRERLAEAGYQKDDVLIWQVSGWGSEKRSVYRPGAALIKACRPDLDALMADGGIM